MKILHIVGEMTLANGVATFVRGICESLSAYSDVSCEVWEESHIIPEKLVCDVIHIHGLWRPMFHRVSVLAHRQNIPVVWSPHGMLQIWALKNKWWKKLTALALYQWRDLHSAALLHATAASEVEDIRRLGLKTEVITVPLGVTVKPRVEGCVRRGADSIPKTLLFVSRVQRKKGLPNLLDAWAQMDEGIRKKWKIRIVGPDEDGHTVELKAQSRKLAIENDVVFVGPKYGEALDQEYDAARLFVLPTHSENFGSVVIEALSHEVPVVCTKAAPWEELLTNNCGWWVEDDVGALVKVLKEACGELEDRTLAKMGQNGRKLVEEKYTWTAVAKHLMRGYRSLR